jgi:hypothetical protein
MTSQDFAGNVALEVNSRLAKIVPILEEFCAEEGYPLSQLQLIALGSLILQVFGDLTETVESMTDVFHTLRAHAGAPSIGDEAAEWLASRDPDGPLQ